MIHRRIASLPAPVAVVAAVVVLLVPTVAPAAAQASSGHESTEATGATGATGTAEVAAGRVEILPLDQVRPGQRGHGLTVFAGQEPERFEVEVIGVMRNTDPQSSFILTRLSGRDLERIGVASGMSGSPIYIDGRLMGGLAFAWPFSQEAVAGITPIEAMRSLDTLPSGPEAARDAPAPIPVAEAPGFPVPTLAQLAAAEMPEGFLERTLAVLDPGRGAPVPADGVAGPAVAWSGHGFGVEARATLAAPLGSLAPAGALPAASAASGSSAVSTAATPGPALVPGGPVAAMLVDGDLRLAAVGTVTEVAGDSVLAFAHPFLGLGPIEVPMASAEVVTIVASDQSSFKVSNLGSVVGALYQDAKYGIRGVVGAEAPTLPMTVAVRGVTDQDFRMRLAAVPNLLPALVSSAMVGSLDAASFATGLQGLDVEATLHLADWGELALAQSFDGPTAAAEASSWVTGVVSYLMGNELEKVAVESIDVTLRQVTRPRVLSLVRAHADRTVVEPGDTVRLLLTLRGYRGESFRRVVEVPVPEDQPPGRLSLLVGDGESADAAVLAVAPRDPVSFGAVLDQLRSYRTRRELVVLALVADRGLSASGAVMPRLPGSIRSIWSGAGDTTGAQDLRLAVTATTSQRLDVPLSGIARVDLEVRPASERTGERSGDRSGEDG